ncbi:FAD linked oxidase N-terminal protein [Rutstroemia sp. NJR-2017a BVV2]|nr:FAD linked oxidase N-terminal protein [Rutstroemia sp. NJR-2017a BVV2]
MASILASMASFLPSMIPFGLYQGMATAPIDLNCRNFPGDTSYPNEIEWNLFNETLGGKLVASVPIAAVCHSDSFEAYNADACASLQDNWFLPETHLSSSSSAMAWMFTNNSCNPFLPASSCTLGNYVSYAVNATTANDVREAVIFANLFNIRLVIRATGHDYNGKSTGAGALSVWTHYLKSISLDDSYESSAYTGRAVTIGAGVQSLEAYEFANANSGIIVAGNCPTVAIAGGYGQGGGHGPLATKYGLAVDQVLEWQVVTGVGALVTASPTQNSDLFWALSGGGGGTYGVVLSATVKFHPTVTSISSATLQFAPPTTSDGIASYWNSIKVFLQALPLMVDSGLQIVWTIGPGFFLVSPVTGLDVPQATIDSLFSKTLDTLTSADIPYSYASTVSTSFLTYYKSAAFGANVSNYNTGGRLIPRSVVQNSSDSFISVLQTVVDNGYLMAGVTLDVNKTVVPGAPEISINPYWRKTLMNAVYGKAINYTNFATNFQNQDFITNTITPALAALTPNGAAYLNEADFQQPNWQEVFYGANYDRLNSIKAKYDPLDRFYALGAVGSDRWTEKTDGRLCRV